MLERFIVEVVSIAVKEETSKAEQNKANLFLQAGVGKQVKLVRRSIFVDDEKGLENFVDENVVVFLAESDNENADLWKEV